MLHRALQCLVRWKGWQINKILWTYKRKEEGKEERREETFKECKSVPSSLEKGQGKRSLFFKSPHLLLLCHLRRTTFTSAASPAGRPIVIAGFISASVQTGSCGQTDGQSDRKSKVWGVQSDDLMLCQWHLLARMSATPFSDTRAGQDPNHWNFLHWHFYHLFKRPVRVMRGFWWGGWLW